MPFVNLLIAAAVGPVAFYVDPHGDDSATGDRRHPLASIEGARLRRRTAATPGPTTIWVNPGHYEISKPIVFDSTDLAAPVTVAASNPSHPPIIDGARRIAGWTIDSQDRWSVKIPEVAAGQWYFSELFVNGSHRNRPRLPRTGYATIAQTIPPTPAAAGHGFDRFGFSPQDIHPDWANRDDIELDLFHNWFTTTGRIGSIDGTTVTLKAPTGYDAGWADLPKGNRYLVDNVKEALSEPGQWYLDRPSGVLTYIPLPGETPANTDVRAPVAPTLVEVRGEAGKWASGLTLDHLDFHHTLWNVPVQGRSFPQAEVDLSGAINFQWARECAINDCGISQVGEFALDIGAHCQGVTVDHCRLTDLGAGGVKIGTTDPQETSHCQVTDCLIEGGGRRAPAAPGVWIGQAAYNSVARNTIEDFYYTGISVGWTWGYGASGAHHNLIQDNRIGNIGQGVLSDMGGIYTLGVSPGTVLEGNFIHDVNSFSYGGWGIYPDEGSSGILIRHNIVTRCKSAGFHQHYGQDNVVENNIFAYGAENQLMRTRAEDHRSFSFTNNIVLWDTGNLLGSNWTGAGFSMDNNLYWRTDGKPFDFAGQPLAQWQSRGLDIHSEVLDPMFKAPKQDTFTPLPASPLLKDRSKFDEGLEQVAKRKNPLLKPLPKAWP